MNWNHQVGTCRAWFYRYSAFPSISKISKPFKSTLVADFRYCSAFGGNSLPQRNENYGATKELIAIDETKGKVVRRDNNLFAMKNSVSGWPKSLVVLIFNLVFIL